MIAGGGRHLVKYEGAGNDFLVVVDGSGDRPLDALEVRVLCDRRHGVGADGVLRLSPGTRGAALSMELRNADGSRAEMSGNGVRCLVHAAVDAELVAAGEVTVATDAGHRSVRISLGAEPGVAVAQVDMGRPRLLPEPDPAPAGLLGVLAEVGCRADGPGPRAHSCTLARDARDARDAGTPGSPGSARTAPGTRIRWVDMGNPHVVVLVDEADPAWAARWGAAVDAATPGGTNVEVVRVLSRNEVHIDVWERGVGTTLACGTGSCAVAAACWDWGIAGDPLVVHNPGGALTVSTENGSVVLGGPSRRVAAVGVADAVLAARAAELRSVEEREAQSGAGS